MSLFSLVVSAAIIFTAYTELHAEELLNVLSRQSNAFGMVRFESGKEADASLTFYAGDQAAFYSIYADNFVCEGKMTLVSASDRRLTYSTEASLKEYAECPSLGELKVLGPSNDSRVDVFFKSENGKIFGSLEISGLYEQKLAADEDVPVVVNSTPSRNACENVDWEGNLVNTPDLFLCDEVRAINALSAERSIQLRVDKTSFSDGWLFAMMIQRDSYSEYMLSPSMINTITFSQAIDIKTKAKEIYTSCALKMPLANEFKVGDTISVIGKMIKYERSSFFDIAHMVCRFE